MECGSPCCKNSLKIPQMCRKYTSYSHYQSQLGSVLQQDVPNLKLRRLHFTLLVDACQTLMTVKGTFDKQTTVQNYKNSISRLASNFRREKRLCSGLQRAFPRRLKVWRLCTGSHRPFFSLFLRPSDKKTTTTSQI